MEVLPYNGFKLETYGRAEFIADVWDYRMGEHVTIIAPTGWGKTTLTNLLLGSTAREDRPSVTLGVKPRDRTLVEFIKEYGHERVTSWPPTYKPWKRKPPGHVVWPRHDPRDFDATLARLYDVHRAAIVDAYAKGNRIINADEVAELSELGLDTEIRMVWRMGRAMGTGMWAGTQRPVDIPVLAYGSATHLLLGNDRDKRARQRYDEIGGVDPGVVREVTRALRKYQYLYMHRDGPTMAVIDSV